MARKNLTDRNLKSLKPAPDGRPYEVMDAVIRQMGVRVMGAPAARVLTFILIARFPPRRNPTRRALGSYGALTLEAARTKARHWLDLIAKGIDPAIEEERHRQAELQRQENTFAAVFEAFVAEKLSSERKGWEVERDVKKEFLPRWGTRPITDITDLDVLAVINAKKRKAPVQARNLLGYVRRLFDWAIDQRVYGLKQSPCDGLKPSKIIGKKKSRQRTLSDDELFALWRVMKSLPYPVGPAYQLLTLTGLRLNEAVDASWSEFDPAVVRALRHRKDGERIDWAKLKPEQLAWKIPAERMKGKDGDARPHMVPLTPDVLQILESLPLFKKGDYLFSANFGAAPVWIASVVKRRVDARMLRTLKALARYRGDDPAKVELAPWVNHDIRRTVRSHLSRLKITEEAREAVLAHARPGIKGTYDLYDYADEKREALDLWAARLHSIVEPPRSPAAKIIELTAVRA